MPIISQFFGIIIRMYYDEHNPPHLHAEYQGEKAIFDFYGNILQGNIRSRTVIKLIREWVDLHLDELKEDWRLSKEGKSIKIAVLQRGWVYIGEFSQIGDICKLEKAACIRRWGTSKGLGELVAGPTNNTVLDKAGTVEFHILTTVNLIEVNGDAWSKQLV